MSKPIRQLTPADHLAISFQEILRFIVKEEVCPVFKEGRT
jgi:hypothetical protein